MFINATVQLSTMQDLLVFFADQSLRQFQTPTDADLLSRLLRPRERPSGVPGPIERALDVANIFHRTALDDSARFNITGIGFRRILLRPATPSTRVPFQAQLLSSTGRTFVPQPFFAGIEVECALDLHLKTDNQMTSNNPTLVRIISLYRMGVENPFPFRLHLVSEAVTSATASRSFIPALRILTGFLPGFCAESVCQLVNDFREAVRFAMDGAFDKIAALLGAFRGVLPAGTAPFNAAVVVTDSSPGRGAQFQYMGQVGWPTINLDSVARGGSPAVAHRNAINTSTVSLWRNFLQRPLAAMTTAFQITVDSSILLGPFSQLFVRSIDDAIPEIEWNIWKKLLYHDVAHAESSVVAEYLALWNEFLRTDIDRVWSLNFLNSANASEPGWVRASTDSSRAPKRFYMYLQEHYEGIPVPAGHRFPNTPAGNSVAARIVYEFEHAVFSFHPRDRRFASPQERGWYSYEVLREAHIILGISAPDFVFAPDGPKPLPPRPDQRAAARATVEQLFQSCSRRTSVLQDFAEDVTGSPGTVSLDKAHYVVDREAMRLLKAARQRLNPDSSLAMAELRHLFSTTDGRSCGFPGVAGPAHLQHFALYQLFQLANGHPFGAPRAPSGRLSDLFDSLLDMYKIIVAQRLTRIDRIGLITLNVADDPLGMGLRVNFRLNLVGACSSDLEVILSFLVRVRFTGGGMNGQTLQLIITPSARADFLDTQSCTFIPLLPWLSGVIGPLIISLLDFGGELEREDLNNLDDAVRRFVASIDPAPAVASSIQVSRQALPEEAVPSLIYTIPNFEGTQLRRAGITPPPSFNNTLNLSLSSRLDAGGAFVLNGDEHPLLNTARGVWNGIYLADYATTDLYYLHAGLISNATVAWDRPLCDLGREDRSTLTVATSLDPVRPAPNPPSRARLQINFVLTVTRPGSTSLAVYRIELDDTLRALIQSTNGRVTINGTPVSLAELSNPRTITVSTLVAVLLSVSIPAVQLLGRRARYFARFDTDLGVVAADATEQLSFLEQWRVFLTDLASPDGQATLRVLRATCDAPSAMRAPRPLLDRPPSAMRPARASGRPALRDVRRVIHFYSGGLVLSGKLAQPADPLKVLAVQTEQQEVSILEAAMQTLPKGDRNE